MPARPTPAAQPSSHERVVPGWAAGVGLRPVEDRLTPDDLATADEAFLSSSVAGVLPVTSFDGEPIGDGSPGPWTLRARADREAMIASGHDEASDNATGEKAGGR